MLQRLSRPLPDATYCCLTQPDNPEVVPHSPPGPGAWLETLFMAWNPAGRKRRLERVRDDELEEWLLGFLLGPHDEDARHQFLQEMYPIGWRLIGLLRRFGVRAQIREDDRYHRPGAGHYSHERKTIVLPRRQLGRDDDYSVVRHEVGHAIEHLITALCNQNGPISELLWRGFASQRTGFVSEYAQTDPEEYFAESVEGYFHEEGHEVLRTEDPGMFAFLDALFGTSNL
ncbi:MAG: hypothetical protein AB7S38_36135 [Vulcanimicrobiota bacterium]